MSKKVRIVILQDLTTNKKLINIWYKDDYNPSSNHSVILDQEVDVEHFKQSMDGQSYETE